MVENTGNQDMSAEIPVDEDAGRKTHADLIEVQELDKMRRFLEQENEEYKLRISELIREIEGVSICISACRAQMEAYESRREKCVADRASLEARKESLITDINRLRLAMRAAAESEERSLMARDTLMDELDQIRNERVILTKKLDDMKAGAAQISREREHRLPHLKGYDEIFKEIHNSFRRVQNRMEVVLQLSRV